MTDASKRLVLLHHAGKEGRAAWFDVSHRAALTKVASEPGFALIEVDQAVLDEADPNMAEGRLAADGKPEKLPVVLRPGFERLLGLAAGQKAPGTPRSPWDDIVVGSVVLASDSKEDGWHECVVAGIEANGQTLHLRWRDYPDFPPFTKPVNRIGLLPRSGLR